MPDADLIGFRPLGMDDLDLMHRWLNAPHVAKWWGAGPTLEAVVEKYRARIEGREPTHSFLILHGGQPIGYIQSYRMSAYPVYEQAVGADRNAAGVDLFIGAEEYLNLGLGTALLAEFLRAVVFSESGIESCYIGPAAGNRAAIRAYEKVGFRYIKTVQVPGEPEPEYLMLIARAALLAGGRPA
jgi:aminoglycoside 6'-N-acetyltransferase